MMIITKLRAVCNHNTHTTKSRDCLCRLCMLLVVFDWSGHCRCIVSLDIYIVVTIHCGQMAFDSLDETWPNKSFYLWTGWALERNRWRLSPKTPFAILANEWCLQTHGFNITANCFFCCECSLFIKLWHFCQLWPCFFRMGQIENENTFVLFYTFTLYSTVFTFRSCHTNQYFQKRLPPGLHPLSVWPAKPHNITWF